MSPITEFRTACRSPLSLLIGGCVGAAAPLTNYYTVHVGRLIQYVGDTVLVSWTSPLWILVAGAFGLSSKSVYRWGRSTFGDPWSAAALVAMLEGALLLSPDPLMARCALWFLVAINAVVYGSALALQYQADKAAAQAAAAAAAPSPEPPVAPPEPKPAPKLLSSSSGSSSTPKTPRGDLYERAINAIRAHRDISTEALRIELKVRNTAAAAVLARMEQEGLVGKPDPRLNGRRPVLAFLTQELSQS